tara:strand:+ start:9917 stop:10123 length:207 start_codon:yes stop_codon:yes gene_type:complete
MKNLIKLTNVKNGQRLLIGVPSIIAVTELKVTGDGADLYCRQIKCTGAMVETFWVSESIEEIYELSQN